jgi:hypothetical protein
MSFSLISHFIWWVPTVKLLSHIIDMSFSALTGVNGSRYTDFDHFIWDFGTIKSGPFMPHAKGRQRVLYVILETDNGLFHQNINLLGCFMINSLKYTLIYAFFALRPLPLHVTKLVHLW